MRKCNLPPLPVYSKESPVYSTAYTSLAWDNLSLIFFAGTHISAFVLEIGRPTRDLPGILDDTLTAMTWPSSMNVACCLNIGILPSSSNLSMNYAISFICLASNLPATPLDCIGAVGLAGALAGAFATGFLAVVLVVVLGTVFLAGAFLTVLTGVVLVAVLTVVLGPVLTPGFLFFPDGGLLMSSVLCLYLTVVCLDPSPNVYLDGGLHLMRQSVLSDGLDEYVTLPCLTERAPSFFFVDLPFVAISFISSFLSWVCSYWPCRSNTARL